MMEAGLTQYGQRSRFFDPTNPMDVESLGMQIWPGFKISAYRYQDGCALVVDNCSRFMSTRSVLESMNELWQRAGENEKKWQDFCRSQFVGKSVIGDYGNKKTYIIHDIIFEKNPCSQFFTRTVKLANGEKKDEYISIAKYFLQSFGKQVSDKRQPLL